MTEVNTKRVFNTTTTSAGAYVVRNLEPGTYTVTFEFTGFTKYEVPNVVVQAGRVLNVDAPMTVGTAEQSVQVTEVGPAH